MCVALPNLAHAQTFTVLHEFNRKPMARFLKDRSFATPRATFLELPPTRAPHVEIHRAGEPQLKKIAVALDSSSPQISLAACWY
jgi:hypothetical protein